MCVVNSFSFHFFFCNFVDVTVVNLVFQQGLKRYVEYVFIL